MPDQPDYDLIQRVQQARMAHDAETQPSQVSAVYWIEVRGTGTPTSRAGYWLIRADVGSVDATWATIKAATEAGRLGYKSKVATAGHQQPDERLIHVMTADGDDAADVARVGTALRALGFESLSYQRG